jgi:ABC-2 type transport system ATP-binding protein
MIFMLRQPLAEIPNALRDEQLTLEEQGSKLILTYNVEADNDISEMLDKLKSNGIRPKDIYSRQSSLEEIFIELMEAL